MEMHPMYVALHTVVRGSMVYAERAQTAAISYVATLLRCKYATSVDIFKTRYKKLVTHLELHATRA